MHKEEYKFPEYIIGIGASAGGLESLQEFLSNFSDTIGSFAIIIAQHLSPSYKSMLVQLLSKTTGLKVIEASSGMIIEEGSVYITPPNNDITISGKQIILSRPINNSGPKPSIDSFFISLATQMQEKAIGIILSGTGSDGARGIKEIRSHAGFTIVQDPSSAKYNGMPIAAIDTGEISIICRPLEMGDKIKDILKNPNFYITTSKKASNKDIELNQILELLSNQTGANFSNYKNNSITRRLTKRINALHFTSQKQYLDYVKEHPEELNALFDILLIGVTKFFRDIDSFQDLRIHLRDLINNKKKGDSIRIWITGCASGEEAYTIAIILNEILNSSIPDYSIQIFATDINETSINFARKGIYGEHSLENVPKEFLSKYFIRLDESHYEVIKSLKQLILFSKHDLITNPPFLKLDLLSCRNLLIYFNANLQNAIIPIFQYSLNTGGILFLGKSESIGTYHDLFTPINEKHKIYTRRLSNRSLPTQFPLFHYKPFKEKSKSKFSENRETSLQDIIRDSVYNSYDSPFVIINDNMDIIEIRGDLRPYLRLSEGSLNSNILKLINNDFQIELRSGITKCIKTKQKIKTPILKISFYNLTFFLRIIIKPLFNITQKEELYMLIFETFEEYELTFHNKIETINTDNAKIKELEDELSAAKEYMQSFIEELESSNEELQSLNEEFQSTNEELQSANEELETTNEELQSTNEEMQIAYSELKAANNALEQKEVQFLSTQNKLQTLLNNTLQAFLLIGLDYKILIYNQAAKQLFYRISARSIDTADLIINYIPPENVKDFYNNFNRVKAGETLNGYVSFQNEENEIFWYQYNLSPIKNDAEKIEMISYSLLDISNSKKNEFELEELRELLNLIYENTDTGIAIINSSNILTNVNTGFCKLFAYNRKDILGKNISSILSFFASIDKPDTQNLTSIESKAIKKDGTPFEITIKINQYRRNDGEIFKIIYITDISENKKYKNLLLDTQEAVNVGGWELDLITNHISWTKEVYKIHELEDSFELNKYNFYNFFEPESLHKLMRALSRAIDTGEPFTLELKFITAKKNKRWVRITGKPIQENKKTIKIFFTIQDISEELTVKDEINKLSLVASKTSNAVIITNKKREIQWVNGGFEKLTGYSYEEVKGENPRFLQGHETDPNAIKNIRDNLSLGRTFSEELLNYKKDGSIYWVKIDFTPIHNTLGELTHYIAIERDITREKEDAEKIRSALHEREILLSEIHHRVKNNMAIISGLIELQASYCKDNLLKRTFQESINRIKSIALVHESLYKSGNWAKIQFKEYIEELINNLKRSCNGNKVSIHISSEAMVLDMRYAIPCGLIINELITNSLQHAFRDKDEGNILVSFRNIENTFELRVKDNGSGYNQKEVDRKTSTLGIVLIESLVQQLDGEYKVNSSSGTDSCIYFKIEDEL